MLEFTMPIRAGVPGSLTELWFPDQGERLAAGPDLLPRALRLFHASRRIGGLIGRWRQVQTLMSDLGTLDALEARLGRTTRYQIRRALERDRLEIVAGWNPAAFVDFADSADAQNTNRPNLERMRRLEAIGALRISAAIVDGQALAAHAYVVDAGHGGRARLLSSYSARPRPAPRDEPGAIDPAPEADRAAQTKEFAALVGRVNKALHWRDMQMFRELGIAHYDWGGFSGRADNGIDRFKQLFLGEPVSAWRFDGLLLPHLRDRTL